MADEHPIKQPIERIVVGGCDEVGWEQYTVGRYGITKIEATHKAGEYSLLPYVTVWEGDSAVAEFYQHRLGGVYFEKLPTRDRATDE